VLFAAYWILGKEAVFESLGVSSKGASAAIPVQGIEVLPKACVPEVTLHGGAKTVAVAKGISKIHPSLSHSDMSFTSRLLEELFC